MNHITILTTKITFQEINNINIKTILMVIQLLNIKMKAIKSI